MSLASRLAPWFALATLALALVVGRASLRTSRDGLDGLLFNADFLSPAALYQDVVIDGQPLAGYQFSAATFAVPDQLVYAAARTACGNNAVAMPVWVASLFLLLTAAGVWALCELKPDRQREAVAVGLGGSVVYLGFNAAAGFVHPLNDLLLPVWHNGALTIALTGLAAGLRLTRATDRAVTCWWAAMAAGLTAVGLFSDRFVGFYLVVPMAAVVGADWWRGRVTGLRALIWLAATTGGGLVGLAALRWFQGPADPIGNYWRSTAPDRLVHRAILLVRVIGSELRPGNPLVAGAAAWYVWAVLAGVWRLARPAAPTTVGTVRLFSVVLLLGVTASLLLSSAADEFLVTLDWATFSRYYVGPIGAAYLGWGTWLAGTRRLWLAAPLAGVAAVGWASLTPAVVDRPAIDFYPAEVRTLDEACQARGLTVGLAGYADAKPYTLLSRAGVVVRPVRSDPPAANGLAAFPWLGHIDGYAVPAGFQFVVVEGRPGRDVALPASVVSRLGEPAERVPVGDRLLLVYDRPGDWQVRRFAELDLSLRNRRFEQWEEPIVYPGAAFLAPPGERVIDTPDLSRMSEAGRTLAGPMAHGPYLSVGRIGWHRATFRLSATGDGGPIGYVDVVWTRPDGGGVEVLAATDVYAGDAQEFPLDFLVKTRHRGGQLQFRTTFEGRGRLVLHEVQFARRSRSREEAAQPTARLGRPAD